jgi:adenosylhomocysteine nucleosidase
MKIGIIGAMDVEVAALKASVKNSRCVAKAGMEFCEGQIGQTDVVVVKCGIGKVNAGICVQILADLFSVTHVLNTGVAGSLDNRIDIGDLVVSTDAIYHDFDVTPLGYKPGEVPQLGTVSFEADAAMRKAAVEAVKKADPDIHVFEGRVLSGDQFIAGKDKKKALIETFGGSCAEMEGCAIAHASYVNGLPFVIIRAISDKADDSGTISYQEFEKKAAEDCARLVEAMLISVDGRDAF